MIALCITHLGKVQKDSKFYFTHQMTHKSENFLPIICYVEDFKLLILTSGSKTGWCGAS